MSLVGRGPSRATSFVVRLRMGVWEVIKDEVLYGDYTSREQAIRSACYGARAVEATGGEASVTVSPGRETIAHRNFVFAR
jgi:hypothetical protein